MKRRLSPKRDKTSAAGVGTLEDKAFFLLIVAASLAFAWIVWPFAGAILWGVITAILFRPLYRRLARALGRRLNLAALLTILIVVVIVVLPLTLITASLVQEASGVYDMVRSADLTFSNIFRQVLDALPEWALNLLHRFGFTGRAAVQEKISAGLGEASRFFATQVLSIGQRTFDFILRLSVMLYLTFFLLRDGDRLLESIKAAIPLRADQQNALFSKFSIVIRAAVKGNIVIAALQGALGGLAFWVLGLPTPLLWSVVMAVLSLLPTVGPFLIWLPVAIYFLATGSVWQGLGLIAYGTLVIVLVDYLVRPALVGTDIKLPDYVVLISTLGGLEIFGLNGIVLGPVIAAIFFVVWQIFSASRQRTDGGPSTF